MCPPIALLLVCLRASVACSASAAEGGAAHLRGRGRSLTGSWADYLPSFADSPAGASEAQGASTTAPTAVPARALKASTDAPAPSQTSVPTLAPTQAPTEAPIYVPTLAPAEAPQPRAVAVRVYQRAGPVGPLVRGVRFFYEDDSVREWGDLSSGGGLTWSVPHGEEIVTMRRQVDYCYGAYGVQFVTDAGSSAWWPTSSRNPSAGDLVEHSAREGHHITGVVWGEANCNTWYSIQGIEQGRTGYTPAPTPVPEPLGRVVRVRVWEQDVPWTGATVAAVRFTHEDGDENTFGFTLDADRNFAFDVPEGEYIDRVQVSQGCLVLGIVFRFSSGTWSSWYGLANSGNTAIRADSGHHIVGLETTRDNCDPGFNFIGREQKELPSTPAPTPAPTAIPVDKCNSTFSGFENICPGLEWSHGQCAFHVETRGGTCWKWCREQSHTCIGASDNKYPNGMCEVNTDPQWNDGVGVPTEASFCNATFHDQICICA